MEANSILSNYKYGFRKSRSTVSALTNFQSPVQEAFTNNKLVISIFFYLEEAYPRVWRHLICRLLHEISLRGNLPLLLQSFLSDHQFQVRIGDHLSNPPTPENGAPLGAVPSIYPVSYTHLTLPTIYSV